MKGRGKDILFDPARFSSRFFPYSSKSVTLMNKKKRRGFTTYISVAQFGQECPSGSLFL